MAIADEPASASSPSATSSAPGAGSAASNEKAVQYHDESSCISTDQENRLLGWVDQTHCVFSWRANSTARWLDKWFDETDLDLDADSQASSLVTIHEGLAWDQVQGWHTTHSIGARMDLPAASRRFKLVVEDNRTGLTPSQLGVPQSQQQTTPAANSTSSVALRWVSMVEKYSNLVFDLGVRSGPEIFVRGRFQRSVPFGDVYAFHFKQYFIEGVRNKAESYTEFAVERLLDKMTVARISSTWDWRQRQEELGLQWVDGISISHQFSKRSSISTGLHVSGVSKPQLQFVDWGPGANYRQNIFRPWLFYEVNPAYTKERDQGGRWVASIEIRLEVLFGH